MDYVEDQFLVETEWLEQHLNDEAIRIVDLRGYVKSVTIDGHQIAKYVGAPDEYAAGHIPGALYLDWTSDIVDVDDPVEVQVASAEKIAQVLGEKGIGNEHLIVAYDVHPTAQFATRLWWVLQLYGHTKVVVLNGGYSKWQREHRPVQTEIPSYPQATFLTETEARWRATAEQVKAAINQPGIQLVDARDVGQYTGTVVRGHGRPGHIPSAISLPREELVDAQTGTFLPIEQVKDVFVKAELDPEKQIIAYCNGGVAATTVLFNLARAGYPTLTNYDGSWNEWGEREDLPTEV